MDKKISDFRSKIESILDIFIFPSLTDIVLDYSHTHKFSRKILEELFSATFSLHAISFYFRT